MAENKKEKKIVERGESSKEEAERVKIIKAWEEAEIRKVDIRLEKQLASVEAWKIKKKAAVEAAFQLKIKKIEEKENADILKMMKDLLAKIQKEEQKKKATSKIYPN